MTNQPPPPNLNLNLNWAVTPDLRRYNFLSTFRVPQYRVGDGVLYSPSPTQPAATYTIETVLSPNLTTTTNTRIEHRYQLRRRTPFPRHLDALVPAIIVPENHIVQPQFRVGDAVRMWVSGGGRERGMQFRGRVVGFWGVSGEYVYEVELEGVVRVWEGELVAERVRAAGDMDLEGEEGRARPKRRGRGRSGEASWVREDLSGGQITALDSMLENLGFESLDFDEDVDDHFFDDDVGGVELTAFPGSLS